MATGSSKPDSANLLRDRTNSRSHSSLPRSSADNIPLPRKRGQDLDGLEADEGPITTDREFTLQLRTNTTTAAQALSDLASTSPRTANVQYALARRLCSIMQVVQEDFDAGVAMICRRGFIDGVLTVLVDERSYQLTRVLPRVNPTDDWKVTYDKTAVVSHPSTSIRFSW